MKKTYETPSAEKMEFNYRDQVVAASQGCQSVWINVGEYENSSCVTGNKHQAYLN